MLSFTRRTKIDVVISHRLFTWTDTWTSREISKIHKHDLTNDFPDDVTFISGDVITVKCDL